MRNGRTHGCRKFRNKHSKDRARERYGLALNLFDLKEAIALIKSNKACFIRRRSYRVSEWLVEIKGNIVRVLYDKNHHCIATILPLKEGLINVAQER